MKITNTTVGHRGVNIRGTDDAHGQVSIAPGQTVDAELFDAHNPVYKGWETAGQMDFGGELDGAAKESLARIKADAEAAKPRRGRPPKADAVDGAAPELDAS